MIYSPRLLGRKSTAVPERRARLQLCPYHYHQLASLRSGVQWAGDATEGAEVKTDYAKN